MSERAPLRDVPKSIRGILHAFAFLIETSACDAAGITGTKKQKTLGGADRRETAEKKIPLQLHNSLKGGMMQLPTKDTIEY